MTPRLNVNPADSPPWARRPRRQDDPPPRDPGSFATPTPDPWHDPTVPAPPPPF